MKTYSVGQWFRRIEGKKNSIAVLSQVDASTVALIIIDNNDANRHVDPVLVEHIRRISEREFKKMCGRFEFEEVTDVYIVGTVIEERNVVVKVKEQVTFLI